MPPGLLIAAPRSGSGKTTLTLGLLRALARAGRTIQPFKCGPDYIDTAFQAAAARRPSYNLDSWAMNADTLSTIAGWGSGADLTLAEGLMGLFDGVAKPGASGDGSSAGLAARFGWPVVLVIDVSGQSQSAAAVALGFSRLRDDVRMAGVVLNRIGSARHERLARDAIEAVGLPVLGALPRETSMSLPERHLGLVQAAETEGLDAHLDRLADFVFAHVDVERLAGLAAGGVAPRKPVETHRMAGIGRIALADDAAFSFVYPHIMRFWRENGIAVVPFSPLANEPPPDADLCWLPGGYPELHAARLSRNACFMEGLRAFARDRPVHGECGGYMVLGETLEDASGATHAMAGLLGLRSSFATRRLHLGYRTAELCSETAFAAAGACLRGHEFHYASVLSTGDDRPLYRAADATGEAVAEAGTRRHLATGSFFHMIDAGMG